MWIDIDLLAGNDAQSHENSSNMSGLCIPCRNKVLWARNCPSNSVSPFHTFTLSPFGLFIFLLFHLVTASPFTILTVHLFTLSHFFAFHHFTFSRWSSVQLFSSAPFHRFTFSPATYAQPALPTHATMQAKCICKRRRFRHAPHASCTNARAG